MNYCTDSVETEEVSVAYRRAGLGVVRKKIKRTVHGRNSSAQGCGWSCRRHQVAEARHVVLFSSACVVLGKKSLSHRSLLA